MNKLIIAGNGFDLAHGLPTSYNHFMDAFWRNLKDDYEDELVKQVVFVNDGYNSFSYYEGIENYEDLKKNLRSYSGGYKYRYLEKEHLAEDNFIDVFRINNTFFKQLNDVKSIQNWVDVENEYYKKLKIICKLSSIDKQEKREQVLKLHKEFEQVKQLLKRYLQRNVMEAYDFKCNDNFRKKTIEMISRHVPSEDTKNLTNEFLKIEDQNEVLSFLLANEGSTEFIKSSLMINFNYTTTIEKIIGFNLTFVNHIHGELNKNIVFGFGDEMDDDYKLIENMDDNEYLRYFKSFQYVQNSNYKDILRYVDSGKFQVIIMGHSCGLSDRTLLNTIFEHDNCRSIKVFYHQKDDGTDNYTEIIQNISRHFNDKKLMRTKIVEKTLCEPMPQIQLPKKE